jgi:ferrous iron transport protein B
MPLLSDLKPGQCAVVTGLPADVSLAIRLSEMGLLKGTEITFVRCAPLGDPMEFRLRGFELSIRRADAAQVTIELLDEAKPAGHVLPIVPPSHVFSSGGVRTAVSIHHVSAEESPVTTGSPRPKSYAVVGNPNSGKTTLFNALTGLRQKVGNYPGVTVEKKSGQFIGQHGEKIELLDLPGSYSLGAHAPDERITRDVLLDLRQDTPRPDRLLCVVDASHLERNLYFISQVLELGLPTVIALNMVDVAQAQGTPVSAARLSEELGVPVIPVQATRRESILPLRLALSRAQIPSSSWSPELPAVWTRAADAVAAHWPGSSGNASDQRTPHNPEIRVKSALLLGAAEEEAVGIAAEFGAGQALAAAVSQRAQLDRHLPEWREAIVAARYDRIARLTHAAHGGRTPAGDGFTQRIDDLVTHPLWGWLVFLGAMTLMFVALFTIAQVPMDWIQAAFDTAGGWIGRAMPAGDLRDLLVDGVLAGVGGVVIFLPQILILFFFIGLLEDTGYMARAAFLMDRVMSRVGLHGKSFIPLLSSYACAIPGIMATRTIENPKDRLVTILVAPFMTCSARLPVYALMIAALWPPGTGSVWAKGGMMMALYLLGTAAALLFAWLFKRTILRGETPLFMMELPPYRMPSVPQILQQMMQRAGIFLKRAGTVILGIAIILWFLASFPKFSVPEGSPGPTKAEQLQHSFAGHIGRTLEPVIRPLGMDWKIGIGLVAAQAAREVFCGTMAVVYNVERKKGDAPDTLAETLRLQKRPDGGPVFSTLTCLSILIFFVLSMQCVSTLAVVRRETNSLRWPLFQFCIMTGTAWVASFLVYQGGRFLGFH